MKLTAVLLLVALDALVVVRPAADEPEALLREARALIGRGLLTQAENVLAELEATAAPEPQAHAQLLLGNMAYERARFEEARERYERAVVLFDALPVAGGEPSPALEISRSNLGLARAQLDRRRALRSRAGSLRAALLVTLAGALALAGRLARRASQTAPTG